MTERLYYLDPYLTYFEASVIATLSHAGKPAVRLDRTAFYPTSGGQPFDIGTLDGTPVLDVVDAEDGSVLHVVEREIPAGSRVAGQIDWARRFDHMQQHTGQHVLSAAFEHELSVRTESFHLGADGATIDLGREVTPDEIARAENAANRVVWDDRDVTVRFVDAAEAAALPLRKDPTRSGTLRLVEVTGYDLSACGGTHVRRTGAIGVIAITGWERVRGGSRIGFVCGDRALRRHRTLRDLAAKSGRLLSIHESELPAAIERLQDDLKEAMRRLKSAQTELAASRAQALAAGAADGVIVAVLDGWDLNGLKSIASAIVCEPGRAAGLIATPMPGAIVVARSADRAIDCAAVLRAITGRYGGKGGGRPELAQGGGVQGEPADIAALVGELLRAGAPQ